MKTSDDLAWNGAIRKALCRRFIERNWKKAQKFPALCAAKLRKLGYFSDNTNDDTILESVHKIIRDVKAEGRRFLDYVPPKHFVRKLRKKRGQEEGPTLLDRKDVIARDSGKDWTQEDTDIVIEYRLNGYTFRSIKRYIKAIKNPDQIKRHFETYFYNEQTKKAIDYQPGPDRKPGGRFWRVRKRITPVEDDLIKQHRAKGLPTVVTARLLARPEEEIAPTPEPP